MSGYGDTGDYTTPGYGDDVGTGGGGYNQADAQDVQDAIRMIAVQDAINNSAAKAVLV